MVQRLSNMVTDISAHDTYNKQVGEYFPYPLEFYAVMSSHKKKSKREVLMVMISYRKKSLQLLFLSLRITMNAICSKRLGQQQDCCPKRFEFQLKFPRLSICPSNRSEDRRCGA